MKIENGVITALVTPFLPSGEIDYSSFENLLSHQWENGVKQFVVNGTTAESPNLEKSEVEKLVACVKSFSKEAKIILGTGSNSTKKTIDMTNWGASLGVDAALVVVPYYNKPPQEGMKQHFSQIAKAADIPLVMYNVPGRTVVSMAAETSAALSEHKNIIGIKEASGDLSLMSSLKEKVKNDWLIYSGDDDTCLSLCLAGGHGVISVVSHIIPKELTDSVGAAIDQKQEVLNKFKKYEKLMKLISIEPNPIPVKAALKFMGIIKHSVMRLPLIEMSQNNADLLYEEMVNLELI